MTRQAPKGHTLPPRSALSSHWDLDPGVVFLNHGSFGACPRVVLQKQSELRTLMEREPVRFFVELLEPMLDEARATMARFVNADADGFAFVPNATAGVNAVVSSLRLAPGDELVTGPHEYNACTNVLRVWAERWGARLVRAPGRLPVESDDQIVDEILSVVNSRTRLVLVSHVSSATGLVLPVARVARELERRGVDMLVDGAHAPGMIPLDVSALNVPYYTGNFHKWLCTPKGSAFLHVRADRRDLVRPAFISHGANTTRTDRSRFRAEFDYTGTGDATAYLATPAALEFLSTLLPGGLPALMAHNRAHAVEGRRILIDAVNAAGRASKQWGTIPPIAPESMLGSLASVELPLPKVGKLTPSARGYHEDLVDRLITRHSLQAPAMPWPLDEFRGPGEPPRRLVRIAMQAYNTLEEVSYFAKCLVKELAREHA